MHVKEARKQCFLEETEHDCGSFQNGLDESDWLADLYEIGILDVFKDVGLSTVQTARLKATTQLTWNNVDPLPPPYTIACTEGPSYAMDKPRWLLYGGSAQSRWVAIRPSRARAAMTKASMLLSPSEVHNQSVHYL